MLDGLVITHDTIAEGVHFLPDRSAGERRLEAGRGQSVATSPPRARRRAAALLSLTIAGDGEWEDGFLGGVEAACESYGLPLIGGDTIALPAGAPRVLGMTAIGTAGAHARRAAAAGPATGCGWSGRSAIPPPASRCCGTIESAAGPLVDVYRRPVPLLAAGQAARAPCHAR